MRRKFILKEDRLGVAGKQYVYEYTSHDYGLARDDTMATGEQHIAVTLCKKGSPPFITAPLSILEEI